MTVGATYTRPQLPPAGDTVAKSPSSLLSGLSNGRAPSGGSSSLIVPPRVAHRGRAPDPVHPCPGRPPGRALLHGLVQFVRDPWAPDPSFSCKTNMVCKLLCGSLATGCAAGALNPVREGGWRVPLTHDAVDVRDSTLGRSERGSREMDEPTGEQVSTRQRLYRHGCGWCLRGSEPLRAISIAKGEVAGQERTLHLSSNASLSRRLARRGGSGSGWIVGVVWIVGAIRTDSESLKLESVVYEVISHVHSVHGDHGEIWCC